MRTATTERLRRELEAIVARVRTDATAMVEQTRTGAGGQGGGELSNAPMHLGDQGTEEYLYDLNAALLENEQYIVSEARDALRRMDQGGFGKCESCGRAIAEERLKAMPYARYCVTCAETNGATPETNLNRGRPLSPRDTLAPEGEMEEDRLRRVDPLEAPPPRIHRGDVHAAGTAGGGTAVGGLAGSNAGDGEPVVMEIDEATASGYYDAEDDRADDRTPLSGPSGGAIGGTPARKRSV